MAQAYPRSRFVGYDSYAASILRARQAAAEAGLGDRVSFEAAGPRRLPGAVDGLRPHRLFRLQLHRSPGAWVRPDLCSNPGTRGQSFGGVLRTVRPVVS
ncbi:MAG TPA: hypothetical protein VKV73_08815 [Chloroflexota bacterium]|nr:hypothetical protein [Chloroflexota bacterium]